MRVLTDILEREDAAQNRERRRQDEDREQAKVSR
jgi:hypothetical protein